MRRLPRRRRQWDHNPYYNRLQLRSFKRGARQSDVMSGIASTLSETEIFELARQRSAGEA
jgi:cytochrome c553